MGLYSKKCTFRVRAANSLGFYQLERGIEANLDKCEGVIKREAPTTKKEIMKMNGMLTILNRFISSSTHNALPLYRLLNKEAHFDQIPRCERVFISLK